MRALALGLLLLAAVVFVLTRSRSGGWEFATAAAEAAMVGAIADWFAVTALFRHPLGLPIPHTAIIPRRKDALAAGLEAFVAENFLTEENVRRRIASTDAVRRIGRWLTHEPNAARVVDEAAPVVGRGLRAVREDEVRTFLDQALLPRLAREDLSALAGHLLDSVLTDGAHHNLVDLALSEGHRWLRDNPDTVAEVVGARAPWWSPQWLDDKVIERVHQESIAWVADVRDDPRHPARRALDRLLRQLAADLQHDPDTRARAARFTERLWAHPGTGDALVAAWDAIRAVLLDALDDPGGVLRQRVQEAVRDLGEQLAGDTELRSRLEVRLSDAAAGLVTTFGGEIAGLVSQAVNRWDGREAAERIELHVGRDLQFIRINGTVVGALVGLLIHLVEVVS